MKALLRQYKNEIEKELSGILSYWEQYAPDKVNGGFYGEVSNDNIPNLSAEKGSVLNARILWAFSHACNYTKEEKYLPLAKSAYQYILDYFIDKIHGGVYWTVDAKGGPAITKKQIYAQAFVIYGLCEFYKANHNNEVLQNAISLFHLIEQHSFDSKYGGYYEAFSIDWKHTPDVRLSEKDQNDAKTMNTHLHIVEAYASLYCIWKDEKLKKQIQRLLDIFLQHIIDKQTNHLALFFNEPWKTNSSVISFGHDIEAAWLLQECAESIEDNERIGMLKEYALSLTDAALQGIDADGGLFYEQKEILIKEKHWWVQAEAMAGLLNAYQLSNEEKHLYRFFKVWQFIQSRLQSPTGEWWWGIDESNNIIGNQYKIGLWKCPYHNVRACTESIKRIDDILL